MPNENLAPPVLSGFIVVPGKCGGRATPSDSEQGKQGDSKRSPRDQCADRGGLLIVVLEKCVVDLCSLQESSLKCGPQQIPAENRLLFVPPNKKPEYEQANAD